MPQPINYMAQMPQRPQRSLLQDYGQVQAIKQQNLAMQQAQQQMAQKQAFQRELQNLGPQSSIDQWNRLYQTFPEQTKLLDSFSTRFDLQNKDATKSMLTRARMALQNGQPEVASGVIADHARAVSQYNPEQGKMLEDLSTNVYTNPDAAGNMLDIAGSRLIGEDYLKAFQQQADIAQTGQETLETQAKTTEMKAKERRAEADWQYEQTQKGRTLPEGVSKMYDKANESELVALKDLSKSYEVLESITGIPAKAFVAGKMEEIAKDVQESLSGQAWGDYGPQLTLLGSQLAGQRLSEAMKMKAAGALSEGEMKELLKTTPPAGSSKEVMTNWVMARIKAAKALAAVDSIQKAFYLDQKSSLPYQGKTKAIIVNGKKIPLNDGDDANRLIAKVGKNLHKFAPEFSVDTAKRPVDMGDGGDPIDMTPEQEALLEKRAKEQGL